MRRVLGFAAALCLSLLVAAPASAQTYPPEAPSCGISDTVVVAGQGITITCEGWQPGSEVTATFFSHPAVIGSDTADANGDVVITGSIPGDAELGAHVIRVEGIAADGEPAVVEIGLTVVSAAAAGVPPGEVAVTGQNITVGLLLLVGLLAAGTVALLAGRRRARTTR